MLTWKKIPWLSLVLLLVTYSTLGWILSAFSESWFIWMLTILGIVLLDLWLSSSWSKIRDHFVRLFKSDSRTFLVAVAAAFLTVFIITWLHIFVHILVIISSGILARLDTQVAGLREWQVFWTLLIISLVGLGLGTIAQTLIGYSG